jgi:hypothetical protein
MNFLTPGHFSRQNSLSTASLPSASTGSAPEIQPSIGLQERSCSNLKLPWSKAESGLLLFEGKVYIPDNNEIKKYSPIYKQSKSKLKVIKNFINKYLVKGFI